ncbi:MAG: cytochrome c3 family protein [Deltaproteobacteria bacterium]|nr:cytochrome c3 family protein [Deltaproteobacteria bacterium]
MLKKSLTIAMVSAITFGFIMITAGVSLAKNVGPETFKLTQVKRMGSITFTHRKHQGRFECKTCHHTKAADGTKGPYVAGQEALCNTCHKGKRFPRKMMKFCKTCHKKMKKEGKNPPVRCRGCHVK